MPLVRTVRERMTRSPDRAARRGDDLVLQQLPHFARDARQHDDDAAGVFQPEPGRGAPLVPEHRGAAGHLGLEAIDGGGDPAHPREPLDQRLPDVVVELERRAVQSRRPPAW